MQFTLLTNFKNKGEKSYKKIQKTFTHGRNSQKIKKELHLINSTCGKPRPIITHFLW